MNKKSLQQPPALETQNSSLDTTTNIPKLTKLSVPDRNKRSSSPKGVFYRHQQGVPLVGPLGTGHQIPFPLSEIMTFICFSCSLRLYVCYIHSPQS